MDEKSRLIEEVLWMNALEEDPVLRAAETELCKKDFYYWLTTWCKTKNEHHLPGQSPYQPIPKKAYLKRLAEVFEQYNDILIPKSRQLMVTWFCVAYFLHRTIFFTAQQTAFQSKEGPDVTKLMERAKGIYDRLPYWMASGLKYKQTPRPEIYYPKTDSVIVGVPDGPDKMRSLTLSNWFCDEAAFQTRLNETWRSVAPTLDRSICKTVLVSSADPGHFEAMVKDQTGIVEKEDDEEDLPFVFDSEDEYE